MKIKFNLKFGDFAPSSRTITPQGYLLCTGVQLGMADQVRQYYAAELGDIPNYTPDQVVNVFTSAATLFDPATIASFQNVDATDDHPVGNAVNSATWSQSAIGTLSNVSKQDNYLVGDILVKDQNAINLIQTNQKIEVSLGYSADLVMGNGMSPDNIPYQASMTNMIGNHVAIVEYGRCGGSCRIGDTKTNPTSKGDKTMKIVVDGLPFEVADNPALEAAFAKQTTELKTLKEAKVKIGDKEFGSHELPAVQAVVTTLVADSEKLKTENTELKTKTVTPEQLDSMVSSRVAIINDAKKLVADVKTDGCTCEQIQRDVLTKHADNAVVKAVLGDVAPATADAGLVKTAFNALSASTPAATETNAASVALAGLQVGDVSQQSQSQKSTGFDKSQLWKGAK